MADKFDYKKEYKDLYMPKQKPVLIDVPAMNFIMVDGAGDPNTSEEYQDALEVLYGLSFAIKMSKMSGKQPAGYFEYVVPPLEGLWWSKDNSFDGTQLIDKSKFQWTSMIRQPEFVNEEVFNWAVSVLKQKKPKLDLTKARFESLTEGLCVQMMHKGPYDSEPVTLGQMEQFLLNNGYICAISDTLSSGQIRRHHEIYLSDPRKTTPEKLKTVLRHPVKKI
ncbi:GyrI-like domain-containing protein [Desulfosporosinus sp. FKB]|uniref:GyrI-like domain-containing protein n=1 Tax=Desulfosporosinus sp. FKB TaxID=1969835 RepID=UPI000B498C1E|nr:GyrI-like domain-containing protein [Desulfosporosinus sp. FKB]